MPKQGSLTKTEIQKLGRQARKEIKAAQEVPKEDKVQLIIQNAQKEKVEKKKAKEILKRESDDWDVKIDEEITFFDPELSYELTGYRPISDTKGLDFDPTPFQETGKVYESTGKYTTYVPGYKLYNDFWEEQIRRCKEGYTVGRYRITGDNYFWLNFYRLLNVSNIKQAATGRTESFPTFYAEQYKWFHYVELCEKLGYDCGALKPRGVGWSELAACMGVRVYSVVKDSVCIYAAALDNQLSPTLQKCWKQLEFLNTQTQGGLRHLRMVKNTETEKRASKKSKDGTEHGFMSEIDGIIIDSPRKLRGNRVERLFFEEAGSNPTLSTAYVQGEALINVQGTRIGTRFVWGTGGDSGPQLEGLSKMFYNPDVYNILPYKNNYNIKGETVFTAFFIPAYNMCIQYCDKRGVCDQQKAKEYYENERRKKAQIPSELIKYKSEFCFYPEEALIREGENRFDSEKLSEQITNVDVLKLYDPPIIGSLRWPLVEGKIDQTAKPTFYQEDTGKIQITELPMTDEHGIAYTNLYVAGIDSIDSDASSSSGQKDVSNFCIVIKRRQLGLMQPKYVAMYIDRPKDVRDAYNNALKLLQFYNCKVVVEASRVGIITYFKQLNAEKFLLKRPKITRAVNTRSEKQYGCPATDKIIEHQLELIENYIIDYCDQILFSEMLQELIKYSYVNKRKFDIVAAMGMAELGDEDMMGTVPASIIKRNEWKDIGYYYENGRKKYGIIPDKNRTTTFVGTTEQYIRTRIGDKGLY